MFYAAKARPTLFSSVLGFLLICLMNRKILVHSQVTTPATHATSYAPYRVQCPTEKQLLRMSGSATTNSQTLSQEEQSFRNGRGSVTSPLWREFFTNGPGKNTGYQNTALMAQNQMNWPVLGIAHSGGGERATLYGAGVLNALDSGTISSPIRGVYQLASYSTGLSGGSWLIASMTAHNYPTVSSLLSRLKIEIDIILPGGSFQNSWQFFQNISIIVLQKKIAGFKTSLIDFWGIALGQHFLPAVSTDDFYSTSFSTPRGAGMLLSGLRSTSALREFQKPLPIIISNHMPPNNTNDTVNPNKLPIQGTTYIPLSAPIYEYSPFEFGSFDPQLSAFIPTEYLGTSLESGNPIDSSGGDFLSFLSGAASGNKCVRGFDQMSFIMGSSAAVCNTLLSGGASDFPARYAAVINYLTNSIGDPEPLLAHYPNPFKGVNGPMGFDRANSDELLIVDGGENGENIPLNPLLAPARNVDVIMALDASADTASNYPNGASMINTWLRTHRVFPSNAASFPPVPLQPQTWINKGFTTRPTFFGCNASSTQGNGGYPLIVYLPNSPLSSSPTNSSTFQLQYSTKERDAFVHSVTNSTAYPLFGPKKTVDNEWPTCLSCALIDRSRNRLNVTRSAACKKCFARYCYQDGVLQPTSQ
ncbi:Lysophospholipase 1 [Puccinia graminis f. sp. tritici]|uniref:Lysophospholipase n=2 Tax=Puccinia graminis f. sp. tritici TaxID=56615 RepID=E3KKN7_PUCGT|nr:uncharacterized protein PGTG_10333 [Puccinia graminis f. sp. tritici CRL 75-36-700-3]EFP84862.2 hypothetical protein PGTG_10333 [Puccinia graminis f. sp. tritici CRL 75-36-700-3]KAA1069195.1 Lysophospholipase 1 [Puccinia graminis f. sp. tritici]